MVKRGDRRTETHKGDLTHVNTCKEFTARDLRNGAWLHFSIGANP